MSGLLPIAEAQTRLLALAAPLPVEQVPLIAAAGRYAAEDIIARRTQPFADLSAMDGYAVRAAEQPGPWRVTGESAAGSLPPAPISPGEAMRIFTGAPLPPGADCILLQEDAARDGDQLRVAQDPLLSGKHIRRQGSDFAAGAPLVARGDLLTPARIGLAATGGHDTIAVHRPVRISIISTGNELVPPGAEAAGHTLPSSNAPMLTALLAAPGVEIADRGIARDTLGDIEALIEQSRTSDIIITIGGASVGDHDLVKPAFERAGAAFNFWKVNMRPGKPIMAGRLGKAIVLGLPGNPVSAFVTAMLFARPLIAALQGSAAPIVSPRSAILGAPVGANGPRTQFLRGRWADGRVVPLADQDSAALSAMAAAELLIMRPADAPPAAAGEMVAILDIA